MVDDPDVRWRRRFANFGRAHALLSEALEHGPAMLSPLEKEGVVQRFEYTLELAWKTIKDYLEAEGAVISPVTPRVVLKAAFEARILADGLVWIQMLDHRNLLSHTYDLTVLSEAVDAIANRYLPAIGELHAFFVEKNQE